MRPFFASLPLLVVLVAPAFAQTANATPKKSTVLSAPKPLPLSQSMAPLELSPAQLSVADRVVLGKMPCELSAHVIVRPDPRGAGMFVLELGKQRFFMTPVITSTGAIRLEDTGAGAVWLQLGNKSMLMSQKLGKRLADACVSPDQAQVAKALESNPAPSLLEAPVVLQASAGVEGATKQIAVTQPVQ